MRMCTATWVTVASSLSLTITVYYYLRRHKQLLVPAMSQPGPPSQPYFMSVANHRPYSIQRFSVLSVCTKTYACQLLSTSVFIGNIINGFLWSCVNKRCMPDTQSGIVSAARNDQQQNFTTFFGPWHPSSSFCKQACNMVKFSIRSKLLLSCCACSDPQSLMLDDVLGRLLWVELQPHVAETDLLPWRRLG